MTGQEATELAEIAACPDSARVTAREACAYDTQPVPLNVDLACLLGFEEREKVQRYIAQELRKLADRYDGGKESPR